MLLNEELLGGGEFEVAVAPPYTKKLNSVAYGGNGDIRYVAVGDEGSIISSSDGKTWYKRISTTAEDLASVKWITNYNYWLAVGVGSTICYSADGITWGSYGIYPSAGQTPAGLLNGWSTNKIIQNPYTKDYVYIPRYRGAFRKQASYASVSDISGWQSIADYGSSRPLAGISSISAAAYEDNTDFTLLAGFGPPNFLYSRDGINFTGLTFSFATGPSDIATDNAGGVMIVESRPSGSVKIYTTVASTSALDSVAVWNSTNSPRVADFKSQYDISGTGWTDGLGDPMGSKVKVAYGEYFDDTTTLQGTWVLVSRYGKIKWSQYPLSLTGSYLIRYYPSVIPKLYTNNGLSWSDANLPTIDSPVYNAVTYGGGQFIAVGSSGLIVISADGKNWYTKNDNVTKTCVF